jgi:hypothetical protein
MLGAMAASTPVSAAHPYSLVLGGSGAVGRYLLRRLAEQDCRADVLGRARPPAWSGGWPTLRWLRGDLAGLSVSSQPTLLLGAGPLDRLADWLPCTPIGTGSRIVALSSMSAVWKVDSPNPAERRLARRLLDSEQALSVHCAAQAIELLLLRPTLIYGAGIDRSLSPLLRYARRRRLLPWPRRARGRRQPVHADDVAAALLAAARCARLPPGPLALPGASCLHYDQLIDRLLGCLAPGCRRLPLPLPIADAWLRRLAGSEGRAAAFAAQVWRASRDQLADADGWQALSLSARQFMPAEDDFLPWSAPSGVPAPR